MRSYEFYKWRIWIILAFSFVLSLFHRGAMGVISPYLSYDLNATASEISQIASVTFYTYALMQIPAGLLLDYYGYRKVSGIGIFITGIGSILLGLTPYLSLAFLGRLLIGLGTSVIFISVLKAQSILFSKNDFGPVPQGQIWPVEALGPPSRLQMYIRQYRSWYYLDKKLRIICSPFGVMMDSGWNCTP